MEFTLLSDLASQDYLNAWESSEEANPDSSNESTPRASAMTLEPDFLIPNPDHGSTSIYKPEGMEEKYLNSDFQQVGSMDGIMSNVPTYKWKDVLDPLFCSRNDIFNKYIVAPAWSSGAKNLWIYIGNNFPIYPFSAYHIIYQCSTWAWLDDAVYEWNLSWAGSLDPVSAIINHQNVREKMLQEIESRAILKHDEADFCNFVEHVLSDSILREAILSLDAGAITQFTDVLQSDCHCATPQQRRKFDRFVGKLVRETGILPNGLFITEAIRIGEDPMSGGGFADVWRGNFRGTLVAMKVLRIFQGGKNNPETIHRKFCEEALVWQRLKHRNILQFFGISKNAFINKLALVSPWMENGTIINYLVDHEEADRDSLIYGIADGLRYLHTLKPLVVHGDLRAANILIDENHNPRIADFGLARIIDSQASSIIATSFSGKGSMRWQAPELLTSCRFEGGSGGITVKSDVYAFACVCLELFTGEVPFSDLRDGAVIMAVVVRDERPRRPPQPATDRGLDDSYWSLMESCWVKQPAERPSMDMIVAELDQVGISAPRGLAITNAMRVGEVPISAGEFADVWRGELDGWPVAMKVLRIFQGRKNEAIHRSFSENALIWHQVKHKNILRFLGISKNEFKPKLALVSPWMENGTLVSYLRDLKDDDHRSLICDIACGLQYLHNVAFLVHGDLRAANIFVDGQCHARIANFNLARIVASQASSSVATSLNDKGNIRWQAPELLTARSMTTLHSDVYAFACVCLEVFTGEVPFSNLPDGAIVMSVAFRDERPPRPSEPAISRGLDDRCWSVMEFCWVKQPAERPSMNAIWTALIRNMPYSAELRPRERRPSMMWD